MVKINKLVTTITFLLILLVSPSIAEEVIMRCSPLNGYLEDKYSYRPVYKYKSSFFGDKYFVKTSGKWVPFCSDGFTSIVGLDLGWTSSKIKFERTSAKKWVRCKYSFFSVSAFSKGTKSQMLTLDFELGETMFLFSKNSKRGKPMRCENLDF